MNIDIVRAWKDALYLQSLSQEQQGTLPANPAGELELSGAELGFVSGGCGSDPFSHVACPPAHIALSRAQAVTTSQHTFHSFAFFCQDNLFSFNAQTGQGFLSPVNNVCVNGDD
jgi:mersacidin/lichenicidin family type 2 lantibiotic